MTAIGLLASMMATAADESTHSWRDFSGVSNTSFTEPSGDRAMQLSIDVPAPVHDVYTAFTTTEGFGSWAVPVTHVDLRVGGFMESSYDAGARIGDPDNIRNQILAYVPERLLVIRNVHAPMALADAELFQRTVTAIEFVATDANHTRVTMTNAGYGAGDAFAKLYRNFEWGNAYYLSELRKRFEHGPVDWSARAAQQKAKAASDAVTQAASAATSH
ncbi:MAG: SRPBCC domain-containing protein [Proteobacteria bacterium]|nr:SRPBCC domain-containing protein [Pseudomonadota bacterium]